jgi:RNA polymerase sigma factor (sigma-70 family)
VTPAPLVEHAFRHEYGRLVAMLVRRVGLAHLEEVEDAVQAALMSALTAWRRGGPPQDARAWLYRVAWNELLGQLRRRSAHRRALELAPCPEDQALPSATLPDEVRDDALRMLFVCAHERLATDSCLVLALKTVCGFSVEEVASRLFMTEANVYKRLGRARERLRQDLVDLQTPPLEALRSRLSSVHQVIYVVFNEGHFSTHSEHAIRAELCEEAIRLGTLLASHEVGAEPATFALLALMHLHAARLKARRDAAGGLLLLEEQDRSLWDVEHLQQGAQWLARAGTGTRLTRFHLEAGIAAEHCFAPSFNETRWGEIAALYAMRPAWLAGHFVWDAVLADLHHRAGHHAAAAQHRQRALAAAPSSALSALVQRRLSSPR